MNDPRLMWLVSRCLRPLCLGVITIVTVAGCTSSSSTPSSAPQGGAGAQPPSNSIPTDTGSNKLALRSGSGSGGGSNGLAVPVQASAYGSATTVPFTVNSSTLNVSYQFDCSSSGGSGFTADMISGSPDNPGSDDQSIASVSDASGSDTVSVNPQNTPGDYFLKVDSPCPWTIVVQNG